MVHIPQNLKSLLALNRPNQQQIITLSFFEDTRQLAGKLMRGEITKISTDALKATIQTPDGQTFNVRSQQLLSVGMKVTTAFDYEGKPVKSAVDIQQNPRSLPQQNMTTLQVKWPLPVGDKISALVTPKGDQVIAFPENQRAVSIPKAALPIPPVAQAQRIVVQQSPVGELQMSKKFEPLPSLKIFTVSKGFNLPISDMKIAIGDMRQMQVQSVVKKGKLFVHDVKISAVEGVPLSSKITLPQMLPQGENVSIQITKPGVSDILEVVRDMPTDDKLRRGPDQDQQQKFMLPEQQSTAPRISESVGARSLPTFTSGDIHKAVVTAQMENNKLLIQLPDNRTLTIQSSQPLPVGADLTLKVTSEGELAIQSIVIPSVVKEGQTMSRFMQQWDTLTLALRALSSGGHEQGAVPVPKLSQNPAAAIVLFAAAAAQGEPEKWIGSETTQLLQTMGVDLSADFQQLQHMAKPESIDSWRALFFPFTTEEKTLPEQAAFFWKKQEDDSPENRHVRFMINLDLTQLGPLQLDGLLHGKNVSLRLRSHQSLPEKIQQELPSVVEKTLQHSGLTGGIIFETTKNFETEPLVAMLEESHQFNVTV